MKLQEYDLIRCATCGDNRIKRVVYMKSTGELKSIEAACGCSQEFINSKGKRLARSSKFSIPIEL